MNSINILSLLLLLHALGHLQGVYIATIGRPINDWNPNSWILKNVLPWSIVRIFCFALYLVTSIAAMSSLMSLNGFLLPEEKWLQIILTTFVLSLISIFLFPDALYKYFNTSAAIFTNMLIIGLYYLLKEMSNIVL